GILFTGLVPVIELAGPGSLLVQAGGDINFVSQRTGKSYQSGIRTIGNTLDTTSGLNAAGTSFATFGNPYLPMQGASATVLFGVGKGV
ncbi:hypothetical protein ACKI14_49415, partial [Streptomyces turgidiscabies]|uniref:hypothetical protein n=1 Tax=Streptomyces turgidiscabies TaxID=85558 RepID=UPI0038F81DC5